MPGPPAFPVSLGREVDHHPWILQAPEVADVHFAGMHLPTVAGRFVSLEALRERLAELQGDAPAHDTDAVDGINQGLSICLQDVAACQLNHGSAMPVNNTIFAGR